MKEKGLECNPSDVVNLKCDSAKADFNNHFKEVQKLIVPNITSALDYHTVQRLKGSKYLGNIPEVQRAYTYNELLEPPSLFS